MQMITEPTRVTSHSETLIDLLLTTNPNIFSSVGTAPLLGSDHLMIFGECCRKVALESTVSYVRNYKKCNRDSLLSDLGNAPWQVMDTFDDIDDKWTYWKDLFLSVVDRHAPLMKVRVKKDKCEWLDGDIRSLMRSRNYYHREFQKSRSQEVWEKYRALRNEVNRKVRQAKVSHFSTICQELKKQPSCRLAWKRLNSALGHRKGGSAVSHLDCGSETLTDKSAIANKLVDHFTLLPPSTPVVHPISLSFAPTNFHFSELREEDVLRKLTSLDAGKATGPDRISARLLRMVAPTIYCSLTKLFNESLLSGQFPSEWKEANITPIPKSGDQKDINNFRPISVLPIIAKLFEFFVTKQLREYMESNKLLNVAQSGFRSNHCTQDVLLKCTDDWKMALDEGKIVGTVMIDLSKAFDSIDHSLLLKKLDALGIRDKEHTWFENYLKGRRQRVVVSSTCSEWRSVVTGVPQGSILGPLLFLVFVNDLPSVVRHSKTNLYADDTSIYVSHCDPATAGNMLEEDLRDIGEWIDGNGMQTNVAKTQLMAMRGHKKKHPEDQVEVHTYIGEALLQKQDSVKYLGVTVDKHLNWKSHIANVRRICLGKNCCYQEG